MRTLAVLIALLALIAIPLPAKDAKDQLLVNFAGSLKRVTKKEVVIEAEGSNELTFVRTRKTTFRSGGRTVSESALPEGITVNVEAFERLNQELEAVRVTVAVPEEGSKR